MCIRDRRLDEIYRLKQKYGGTIPEILAYLEKITAELDTLEMCIRDRPQGEVRAIGVSTRPRAVEGSYMPCFLAGESVARSAAHLLSVPLFTVSQDVYKRQVR